MDVFTMADARSAGYENAEIQRFCATGEWVRLRRGVYTTATALSRGPQHRSNCVAVLLALGRPSAAVSHGSAARLLGLPVPAGATRSASPTRRGRGTAAGSPWSARRSPPGTS